MSADQATERPTRAPLGSVVIPAHNEAAVIERCLGALLAGFEADEVDVVVVCNGCTDDTAARARRSGTAVRVVELERGHKPTALRAGDRLATAMPRLYLDADVILPSAAARRVLERLASGDVAAARPRLAYDSRRSSAPVRSYFRARSRVPAVLNALWGAGVYGVSAEGRARFDEFPDVVADDLWIDHMFARDEIEIVDCEPVVVTVPRRSSDLLRILRRANRGKDRHATPGGNARTRRTTRATLADLGRLTVSGPIAALDAVTYATFAVGARLMRILTAPSGSLAAGAWERDLSSRS